MYMSWTTLWETLILQFQEFGSGGFELLLLNVVMALLLSCMVFLTYRMTYIGTAFSKKFMISLGMMTLVTTIIMNVIANNVALSLGMVGALSIIRFRTAVKDVRDATYIFWCIGLGICCGISKYAQALVGSFVIMAFLLIAGQVRDEGKYLLIVRFEQSAQGRVETAVRKYYDKGARVRVQSGAPQGGELIYEVSARTVKAALKKHSSSITELLLKTEGVASADLVQQTDDISR